MEHNLMTRLNDIINQGPNPADYPLLDNISATRPNLLKENLNKFSFLESEESIMGHIKLKPYGYAGDFKIIDRIYTWAYSKQHSKWDKYALQNSAAAAVRNRKSYFISKLMEMGCKTCDTIQLLNLASGPARDLSELYALLPYPHRLQTTCIELDKEAITYAKTVTKEFADNIQFVQKNVLRYNPDQQFNIIWSAGLFDYFDDKTFVFMLKKFKNWITEKGSIIIGNFNEDHNPSRNYMEMVGDWYLNHRSPDKLLELALAAGFDQEKISVESEPENVNLFLNIKMG